ncbi:MAG TPA: hypothetical protein VKF40_24705 [Burkholderiales bacterium]|nr:hypothetical protein [Burkholderiales bacterium]
MPRDGIDLLVRNPAAKGQVQAAFVFHPDDAQPAVDITKNVETKIVSPNPLNFTYSKSELHGTTGTIKSTMDILGPTVVIVKPGGPTVKSGYTLRNQVRGTITPGKGENLKVTEAIGVKDPFSFSDSGSGATFGYKASGIDIPFSLLKDTAFPDLFSPDGILPGAVAADTSLTIQARVVPGVIDDPASFWSSPAGALNLFTLTITSDIHHVITALLTLGSSTPSFSVLLSDTSDIASAEDAIEGAFINGVVTSDLNTPFTVSFIPSGDVTAYTLGFRTDAALGAVETPISEPASILLLALGGIVLVRRGQIRRIPRENRRGPDRKAQA